MCSFAVIYLLRTLFVTLYKSIYFHKEQKCDTTQHQSFRDCQICKLHKRLIAKHFKIFQQVKRVKWLNSGSLQRMKMLSSDFEIQGEFNVKKGLLKV